MLLDLFIAVSCQTYLRAKWRPLKLWVSSIVGVIEEMAAKETPALPVNCLYVFYPNTLCCGTFIWDKDDKSLENLHCNIRRFISSGETCKFIPLLAKTNLIPTTTSLKISLTATTCRTQFDCSACSESGRE